MKKTDNYSLPQWEKQDFIKMEDFNDLTQKTDAALKAHDTALGEKATATALAAEAENRSADTVQNNKDFGVGDGKSLTVTWGARQLSWVCSSGGTMSSIYAGNSKNVEYHYVIVGFDNAGA